MFRRVRTGQPGRRHEHEQWVSKEETASGSAVTTMISVVKDENGSQDNLPYMLSLTIAINPRRKEQWDEPASVSYNANGKN